MILKNYPPVIKRGLMENGSFTVDSLINLSSKPPFMVICELAMFDFRRVTVILPSATEHLSFIIIYRRFSYVFFGGCFNIHDLISASQFLEYTP